MSASEQEKKRRIQAQLDSEKEHMIPDEIEHKDDVTNRTINAIIRYLKQEAKR